jgi:mannose PTS system EIIA component
MIGVLLVTHGSIGESLLASASQILGGTPPLVAALGVSRNDDPEDVTLRAQELLEALDQGDGVLVLTDIFGATPGNVIARLLHDGHIEGVSGLSLPMLLRVLTSRNGSSSTSIRLAVERALSGGTEGLVHMNSDRCADQDA